MLQHDNARPHVARICTQLLQAENIRNTLDIRKGILIKEYEGGGLKALDIESINGKNSNKLFIFE